MEDKQNKLYLKYNIPVIRDIQNHFAPQDVLRKLPYQYVLVSKAAGILCGVIKYFDTPPENIYTLFDKQVIREKEKYDILSYKVVSPVIDELRHMIDGRFDVPSYADIVQLKKGTWKKYQHITLPKEIGQSPISYISKNVDGTVDERGKWRDVNENVKSNARGMAIQRITQHLYEGLITSYPIDRVRSAIQNTFNVRTALPYNNDNAVLVVLDKNSINQFDKIKHNMDKYGWFSSDNEKDMQQAMEDINKGEQFGFAFEPKFDIKIGGEEIEYWYHVTPLKNWNRISKIGLVPRSQNKIALHPERVYLTTDQSESSLRTMTHMMYAASKWTMKEYCLLKIKLGGDFYPNLYQDPHTNFGVYTMENIPPQRIQYVKKIWFDNNGMFRSE